MVAVFFRSILETNLEKKACSKGKPISPVGRARCVSVFTPLGCEKVEIAQVVFTRLNVVVDDVGRHRTNLDQAIVL